MGEGPDTDAGPVCSVGLCDRVILVIRSRHDFIKSGYLGRIICRKRTDGIYRDDWLRFKDQ